MALRATFKRHHNYVAVMDIPSADLKAGEEIESGKYRVNIMRHWYRAKKIGVKGDAWTNDILPKRVRKPMKTKAKRKGANKEKE